jgi:hypothetical protein
LREKMTGEKQAARISKFYGSGAVIIICVFFC